MDNWFKKENVYLYGAIVLAVLGALYFSGLVTSTKAKAADKGGAPVWDEPAKQPARLSCMIGVYGSYINGDLDFGAPINIGSNGGAFGGSAECGAIMGNIYAGAGIDYGRVSGDLHTIGVDAAMSVFGKLGVATSANTMVYALLARGRLDTSAGNIDGWGYGGGITTKLPSAPLYVDLQGRFYSWETDKLFGPSVDTNTFEARLGLSYKF